MMMIQKVGALTNELKQSQAVQKNNMTLNFEGKMTPKMGKTMKALSLAAMIGMTTVAMSSCDKLTGTSNEHAEIITPMVEHSPIQIKMKELFQTLGLLSTSEPNQKKTGDIKVFEYKDQSEAPYSYIIDAENSIPETQVYTCSFKSSSGIRSGSCITTIKTTDEGILKRDSNKDYDQLFIKENGKISEYQINDATGKKELAYSYKKNSADPTKIDVFDSEGSYLYSYSGFNIKTAE